ncbi:glutathione S-transferase [Pseudorhodoferax sp.]|uniref:glutathione S-transferase n=1 Tax=Pseudorhodoferax sp. TaxID=1993553 RepID=UPI002DD6302F|nr:glutathione S-transferase [Pseudorhodoferax sp.]
MTAAGAGYTVFGSPGSGSAAIEMALRAAGQRYRVRRASSWEPESDQPALHAANPLAQIPVLACPDGTVLTESAAILIHLGLAHPEAGLLPAEAAARARALRGLVFIAANCYAAVGISDHPERWTTATTAAARDKVRAAARANLHRHWEVMADAFGSDPVLAAPPPGALAFLAVVVSQWSGSRQHLRVKRPSFHALIERLAAHPRLAAVLAEHQGG